MLLRISTLEYDSIFFSYLEKLVLYKIDEQEISFRTWQVDLLLLAYKGMGSTWPWRKGTKHFPIFYWSLISSFNLQLDYFSSKIH